MKSSTIIIGAILLAATFLPLVYLITQTSQKEKKIRKSIQKLCTQNKIVLSELELNGDLILGIDPKQKKVVYSSRKHHPEKFEIIDLKPQTECRVKTQKGQGKHLEWVGIELVNGASKKDIVFYQEDEDDAPITNPSKCLKDAEKWQTLISSLLKPS
ncbi:MAG: hypothetical protein R2781_00440 [Flavobacteriaceae bacterium]